MPLHSLAASEAAEPFAPARPRSQGTGVAPKRDPAAHGPHHQHCHATAREPLQRYHTARRSPTPSPPQPARPRHGIPRYPAVHARPALPLRMPWGRSTFAARCPQGIHLSGHTRLSQTGTTANTRLTHGQQHPEHADLPVSAPSSPSASRRQPPATACPSPAHCLLHLGIHVTSSLSTTYAVPPHELLTPLDLNHTADARRRHAVPRPNVKPCTSFARCPPVR